MVRDKGGEGGRMSRGMMQWEVENVWRMDGMWRISGTTERKGGRMVSVANV